MPRIPTPTTDVCKLLVLGILKKNKTLQSNLLMLIVCGIINQKKSSSPSHCESMAYATKSAAQHMSS